MYIILLLVIVADTYMQTTPITIEITLNLTNLDCELDLINWPMHKVPMAPFIQVCFVDYSK